MTSAREPAHHSVICATGLSASPRTRAPTGRRSTACSTATESLQKRALERRRELLRADVAPADDATGLDPYAERHEAVPVDVDVEACTRRPHVDPIGRPPAEAHGHPLGACAA